MTVGFVEKIKDVKDRILLHLEEIKKSQEVLNTSLRDAHNRIDVTNAQMHDLAAEAKSVQAEHHAELKRLVTPTNDPYSYPPETEEYRRLNPEIALLQHLRSFLPTSTAVDIGANVGLASELLLSAGFRVFAIEPSPDVYEKLCLRCSDIASNFKPLPYAVGAADGVTEFYKLELTNSELAQSLDADLSVYGTTVQHAVPDGLQYSAPIEVPMRSLKSLHGSGELPADVSVVKIGTEGGELEVIRGMNNPKYAVVMTEFWDANHHFSQGEHGLLVNTVAQLRARGYGWHVVIYRKLKDVSEEPRFYCNIDQSPLSSWGNAIFFRDYEVFKEALKWCSSMLRANQSYGG